MSKFTGSILVTGATGNIGALVVERLIGLGHRPRVFARDPDKARARFADRVDIARGDFSDPSSLAAALEGMTSMFLVTSGPGLAELDAMSARIAKQAGVDHLVKLSSLDARHGVGTGVWHAHGEAAIRASSLAYTFVQPTGFMSNALYWARGIRDAGVVRSATGDGKIPFVHPHDIADVCVAALTRPPANAAIPLTGPVALSYAEMTAEIAAAIDRPLRYEPMSEDDARDQQGAWGAEPAMTDARLSIFRAIREGLLAEVTDGVSRTLDRPPVPFSTWARDNAAAFR